MWDDNFKLYRDIPGETPANSRDDPMHMRIGMARVNGLFIRHDVTSRNLSLKMASLLVSVVRTSEEGDRQCEEGIYRNVESVDRIHSPVLQTFSAQFHKDTHVGQSLEGEPSELLSCVCTRERTCITLTMVSGSIHHISMPFMVNINFSVEGSKCIIMHNYDNLYVH